MKKKSSIPATRNTEERTWHPRRDIQKALTSDVNALSRCRPYIRIQRAEKDLTLDVNMGVSLEELIVRGQLCILLFSYVFCFFYTLLYVLN